MSTTNKIILTYSLIMFSILLIAGIVFTLLPYKYENKQYYSTQDIRFNYYYKKDYIRINLGCGIGLDILSFFGIIISCTLYHIQKKAPEDYRDYANLTFQKKYLSIIIQCYYMFFAFLIAGIVLCILPHKYTTQSYYILEQVNPYWIYHDNTNKSLQLHLSSGIFQVVIGLFGMLILFKYQQPTKQQSSKQPERNIIIQNDERPKQSSKLRNAFKNESVHNNNQEPDSIRLYDNKCYERRCSNIFDSVEIIDNLTLTQIGTSELE
ncbi:Hypothetical_protein [Hexamita inflata]|uniref:Hypothetical_protein n=1 Tax=Hexamita inflata TaxID=28002 RepID=A0AA86NGP5_9EUKA|nr:Hypothetical protein HINF_LOCUS6409 [Hexamita inflata]